MKQVQRTSHGQPRVTGRIPERPPERQCIQVTCPQTARAFDIRVKRQSGARRLTLRVNPRGDVVLVIPPRGGLLDAIRFAQSHVDWISQKSSALPAATPFAAGALVPIRGVEHLLEHRPGRGTVWVETGNGLGGSCERLLCVAGDAGHMSRRVTDALKRWALQDLSEATAKHCRILGRKTPAIQLRDPVSRWGSCSSTGVISFSWRLILAPPYVLDYLAAHEAAHLIHMNHSPEFWGLLATMSRDVDRAESWLKSNGPGLHRYGREARA